MLEAHLVAVRDQYQVAGDSQKAGLRKQMAALVARITHVDQLRDALQAPAQGRGADLSGPDLKNRIQEMLVSLDEEEAAMNLTAAAVRTQVAATEAETDRAFRLLELYAQVPTAQLRRLHELQQQMRGVLDRVMSERQKAWDALGQIVARDITGEVPDEAALLRQVDALGAVPVAGRRDLRSLDAEPAGIRRRPGLSDRSARGP